MLVHDSGGYSLEMLDPWIIWSGMPCYRASGIRNVRVYIAHLGSTAWLTTRIEPATSTFGTPPTPVHEKA